MRLPKLIPNPHRLYFLEAGFFKHFIVAKQWPLASEKIKNGLYETCFLWASIFGPLFSTGLPQEKPDWSWRLHKMLTTLAADEYFLAIWRGRLLYAFAGVLLEWDSPFWHFGIRARVSFSMEKHFFANCSRNAVLTSCQIAKSSRCAWNASCKWLVAISKMEKKCIGRNLQ